MKFLSAVLLSLVLLFTPAAKAQVTPTAPTPEIIKATFSRATLALYLGKQDCKWTTTPFFSSWGCEFKSQFVCTATVITSEGDGNYSALTAGHCFDWENVKEHNYYVATNVDNEPVLHKADVLKFENDDRYDFALVGFRSLEDYPCIPLNKQDAEGPAVGTLVTNVNFALGLTKQYQDALVVSGTVKMTESALVPGIRRRFLLNLAAGPGASGSSLVDLHTGQIVGLVEAYFPGTQMPMAGIPTGSRLFAFLQDDSAGLAPKAPGPKPEPSPASIVAATVAKHAANVLHVLTTAFVMWLAIVTCILLVFGLRRKLRAKTN